MSTPTTLLSSKMNELLKGVIDLEILTRSDSIEDEALERDIILIALVGVYTSVEKQIAAHQGPFSQFFRDGLAERFKGTRYVAVNVAQEIVRWMIYEHQLKNGRQAS